MTVKKNATALFLFGGFSSLDFSSFYPQFRSPIDRKTLFNTYRQLSKRDILHFDYSGNDTKIEVLEM
jgi:hypothetical protein